jgi:hypothetical protein
MRQRSVVVPRNWACQYSIGSDRVVYMPGTELHWSIQSLRSTKHTIQFGLMSDQRTSDIHENKIAREVGQSIHNLTFICNGFCFRRISR